MSTFSLPHSHFMSVWVSEVSITATDCIPVFASVSVSVCDFSRVESIDWCVQYCSSFEVVVIITAEQVSYISEFSYLLSGCYLRSMLSWKHIVWDSAKWWSLHPLSFEKHRLPWLKHLSTYHNRAYNFCCVIASTVHNVFRHSYLSEQQHPISSLHMHNNAVFIISSSSLEGWTWTWGLF